jgi:hypothetical protein
MEYQSPGHTTRQVSVSEASRELGKSPETVRRWIKSGRLQAERVIRPQGTGWLVTLPATPACDVGPVMPVTTPQEASSARAHQESGYASTSITSNEALHPSSTPVTPVIELSSLAATVQQQAETIARLTQMLDKVMAELEALRAQNGAVERSGAPQAPDADPSPALLPPTPWWSAVITIMVFATMGALVLLLAWPK